MSRYKRGPKKPPVIVEVIEEPKAKIERPVPKGLVWTYHPRKGWFYREATE